MVDEAVGAGAGAGVGEGVIEVLLSPHATLITPHQAA